MSVFLEGYIDIKNNENKESIIDNEIKWSGHWQFIRDRNSKVKFHYKYKSNEIPNDIINYISFQNNDNNTNNNSKINKKSNNNNNNNNSNNIENNNNNNEKNEVKINNDININIDDNKNVIEVNNNSSILINRSHMLLGYYEGSFNVKSNESEVSVNENFFLYSLAGLPIININQIYKELHYIDNNNNNNNLFNKEEILSNNNNNVNVTDNRILMLQNNFNLPPEQIFSYTVLKVIVDDYIKSNDINNKDKKSIRNSFTNNIVNINYNNINSQSENFDKNNNLEIIKPSFIDAAKIQLESLPDYFTILLGFGQNVFGRFALIGAYNENTKYFLCEKRYMISRYSGINRYRLPNSIIRHNNDNINNENNDETGIMSTISSSIGKRKRTSINRLHYDDFIDYPNNDTNYINKNKNNKDNKDNDKNNKDNKDNDKDNKSKDKDKKDRKSMNNNNDNNNNNEKSHITSIEQQKQYETRLLYESVLPDDIECGSIHNNKLDNILKDSNGNKISTYKSAFLCPETGDIYEGGWIDGYRQGKGICIYANPNHFYENNNNNDMKISLLSSVSSNLLSYYMYEGDWYRGKEQGKGILMHGNRKKIYEGEFMDGVKHGFGTYYFLNGDIYIGDFREGVRHGKGKLIFANNIGEYDGDWRDDKRHGKGIFTWFCESDEMIDGKLFHSSYDGDWENNLRHGRGILLLTNGFYYDGHWDKGIIDGKGECIYPIPTNSILNTTVITKSTVLPTPTKIIPSPKSSPKSPIYKKTNINNNNNNMLNNNSISNNNLKQDTLTDIPIVQQLYQGSFKAGLRDGRGTIIFAEGAEYEGRFRDDRLDGHAGTLKITKPVPGILPDEIMIPVTIQADIKRIHYISGFGEHSTH